jgi:hypothetical protein
MQVMLPPITTQVNAQIAMILITAGGMLTLIIMDTLIVLHVTVEMLQATIIQGSVRIAMIRIAIGGMLSLTIVDIQIVLHVILGMLRATIIQGNVLTATALTAGWERYLTTVAIPIASHAI